MNFKNKILITFLFLLAFLMFFNINSVFGFSFTSYEKNNLFTVPDASTIDEEQKSLLENGYLIYTTDGGQSFTLAVLNSTGGGEEYLCVYGSSIRIPQQTYYSHISAGDSSWGTLTQQYMMSMVNFDSSDFYFGATVYTDRYGSDIFFQLPVMETVTIPSLETAEQIPEAIVTTLKILIPVGLIVLSIGFVVYLIKRVRFSIM